ncbi:MAG: AraC family transcriptional regulator [Bacteroidaceae bacterium]|nr:AraC family transcriptional regulator [Bacteroidaceae bacterium]
MFQTIVYSLPCIACALWSLLFAFRKKSESQKYYLLMLVIGTFYFFTYSLYISPDTDYSLMVRCDVACQPLAIFLLALMLFYVEGHIERPIIPVPIKVALFLPPILHLAYVAFIYYLLTFDDAAILTEAYDKASAIGVEDPFEIMPAMLTGKVHRLYILSDVVLYSGLCAFYSFICLAMCGYSCYIHRDSYKAIPRFFTKNDSTGMVHLVNTGVSMVILSVGPLIIMGRSHIFNNHSLGITMSLVLTVAIFLGAYTEFVGESFFRKIEIRRSKTNKRNDKNNADDDDNITYDDDEVNMDDVDLQPQSQEIVFNENLDRLFIQSMETEKVYTDASLTIDNLAQRLKTNRSTLSALVNKKYGMTFKTMLATYRIAYAKKYMIENPNASVDDIAEVSGFGDRSTFFHKFKEVTGMSPKVWLTKQ